MLKISDFRIEYRRHPLGMDVRKPRFSWKLASDQMGTLQTAYRLAILKNGKTVWDTKRVDSDQSVCIVYAGEALSARSEYEAVLEVTDNHGETAHAKSGFETGLVTAENWRADWITHGFEDNLEPCAVFVKRFSCSKQIQKARLYASALGIYEFAVNGQPGSDFHFSPGWTCYQQTIQYQTYDVTNLLKKDNELRFTVGNGWYKGILGFFNTGNHYGSRTGLIAQLEITFSDGSMETVCTDESWESTTGPVRYNEIYHGEIIDYTQTDNPLLPVKKLEQSKEVLLSQQDEPVRITERISAQNLFVTPEGDVVIDFGQNLTGIVELKIHGQRGQKITVRHAEALDEKGNFYTKNLRTARCTDTFICSGGEDVFCPTFTFHGFRYIAVDGLGKSFDPSCFTACVMHTDLEKAGDFSCSDERVNRLMLNVDWGLRDNFMDIPTDCPQRDERLGYTGDGQIFLPTAMCCRNVALFFEKWLRDLKYEQSKGMGVPTTVPNILGAAGAINIWHDAATIFPWRLYETYGDPRFLEQQYDSMRACVDYCTDQMAEKDSGLIKTGQQLGDWVSMDVPRGTMLNYTGDVWNLELNEKIGQTDPYYIANIYYAYSAELTAQAAGVLGKDEEAKKYKALHDDLIEKIRHEYITPGGRVMSDTQTANIFALHFGIAEEKDRPICEQRLLSNLKQHKNHLTTGFAGTPYLCPTLTALGHHDVAGAVFMKDDCPSWLYHVKLGATTMWELWDGVNPDGSFNKFEMNSLNHYSYGSIGGWVFHDLLGLQLLEPGYKKSRITPKMILGIPEMKGSIETVYGRLSCAISCLDGKYTVDVEIPANTTSIVELPHRKAKTLGSGCYHFEYETEDSFIPARYNLDTNFGEIVDHPVGGAILRQYARELVENEMAMMFARNRPVAEVLTILPSEMQPLIDMVLKQCNDAEQNTNNLDEQKKEDDSRAY